jgi:DNA/RNA endonuclease G (NUC1)
MKVTGHRTRAAFDRCHIVSPADLQDVAQRLAGTFQGTPGVAEVDRRALTSENHSARL